MSATVRQKAAASAKKQKTVIKPVLTSPYEVQWPPLSAAAQQQIEAALLTLLQPLHTSRSSASFLHRRELITEHVEPPVASTSRLATPNDTSTTQQALDPQQANDDHVQNNVSVTSIDTDPRASSEKMSKRANRRRKALQKIAGQGLQIPANAHEIRLRSGKAVQIPDRPTPDRFTRRIKLDHSEVMKMRPPIADALVLGLNNVSRRIEHTIRCWRCQLAGVPPLSSAVLATQNTTPSLRNLRLFVPSPTRGTRRDRRALRSRLNPQDLKRRTALLKKRALKAAVIMPPFLTRVPRGEPALTWILEDLHARAAADVTLGTSSGLATTLRALLDAMRPIALADGPIKEENMHVEDADELDTEAAACSSYTELDTKLVQDLLFDNEPWLNDQDRSVIISLLSRHDPGWFVAQRARHSRRTPRPPNIRQSRSEARATKRRAMPEVLTGIKKEGVPAVNVAQQESPLRVVFVAKADINPAALVDHIALSVDAQNALSVARANTDKAAEGSKQGSSSQAAQYVRQSVFLVTLGKGAEARIAHALGLRRAAVIGLTNSPEPDFQKLVQLIKSHMGEPVAPSWLVPPVSAHPSNYSSQAFLPTHVKHLVTSAPSDPKAARAEKKAGRKRNLSQVETTVSSKKLRGLSAPHVVDQSSGLIDTQPRA